MNERLKELDGIRGIALLLVFFFHALKRASYFTANPFLLLTADFFSIGWVGVDVFFALSGFLITSILLRTKEHPNYFRNFYARRALRILPVYYLLIVLVLVFIPDLEESFKENLKSALPFFLLFQQNWLEFLNIPNSQYIGVTWSLAVEEQFYILWPLVIYLLKRDVLLKAGTFYIFASIFIRMLFFSLFDRLGQASTASFFYYGSFRGFEALVLGSLMAIWLVDETAKIYVKKYSGIVFSLALIAFGMIVIISPETPHPLYEFPPLNFFGYTMIALATCGLIGLVLTNPNTHPIRTILGSRILTFFGKYSYALYLFHMPVLALGLTFLWGTGARGWWMFIVYTIFTLAVTTICALLSWNLLEKHALNLKRYFEYD